VLSLRECSPKSISNGGVEGRVGENSIFERVIFFSNGGVVGMRERVRNTPIFFSGLRSAELLRRG